MQPLGSGGMGAVMLAYDAQLGRRVALKLLHTQVRSPEARIRMMREAQATARLAHPNVVGIYDVGVHDDNIFLALEYIDGVTLGDWMKSPRSVAEVVAVMRQAGQGLEAAHAVGIIHRDFKPANVIIARDGRVVVLDFGIARAGDVDATLPPHGPEQIPDVTHPVSLLTQEGSILGTVGYAPPEQTVGLPTDARSDVFSFCATLWRALYKEFPFPAGDLAEYAEAVHSGKLSSPSGHRSPRWIHNIMVRGLAREPEDRFGSMAELLRALDADPTRRQVRFGVAAAMAVVAAVAWLGTARHRGMLRASCRAEGDEIAALWTAPARAAAKAAMLGDTDAFAGERTTRTLSLLDDYVEAWRHEQTDSCGLTQLERSQPTSVHALRSECLVDLRTRFEVVTELLSGADSRAHRQSLALVHGLAAPRHCSPAEATRQLTSLPVEPFTRARALAARRDLARANVIRTGGQLTECLRLAEGAATVAREIGDRGTEAMAEHAIGHALFERYENQEALRHLRRAVSLADSVGADFVAGSAAVNAALVLNESLHRTEEANAWLDIGRAKLQRLGGDELLETSVLLDDYLFLRGTDPKAALEVNQRAIDLSRRVQGEMHPALCLQLGNRGAVYASLGDPRNAEQWFRETVECQTRANGPHDSALGLTYGNLAQALYAVGRWDESLESARRAATVREALDARNPMLTWIWAIEAIALDGAGRYAEAERMARSAIDIGSAEDLALAYYALGLSRAGQGDVSGAGAACARAAEEPKDEPPPSPAELYETDALRCLGAAELVLGDVAGARRHLEASAARRTRLAPGDLAVTQFALARALMKGSKGGPPPDPKRAFALAHEAREVLRRVVVAYPFQKPQLDAIDQWLAAHTDRSGY